MSDPDNLTTHHIEQCGIEIRAKTQSLLASALEKIYPIITKATVDWSLCATRAKVDEETLKNKNIPPSCQPIVLWVNKIIYGFDTTTEEGQRQMLINQIRKKTKERLACLEGVRVLFAPKKK